MIQTIQDAIGRDTDLPPRAAELTLMRAVLDGTMYDCLKYDFHQERTEASEYIPIAKRRPSVRYNLCRLLVEDAVALLFGDGHFPKITCADKGSEATFENIIDETGLCEVMQEAAVRGSVGSIAILMRVLKSRLFFDVMETIFLTPEWDPEAPDTLKSVTEKYKVKGEDLVSLGYNVSETELGASFWFMRKWDAVEETWYKPRLVQSDKPAFEVDTEKTVKHKLGFVPIVWIKNLSASRDSIDGACTFKPAIDNQIEIEYQLSQGGRGLKYSSDPLLLLKEPAGSDGGSMVRSATNAIIVDKDGDGKLLEIDGTAISAVIEYAKVLRELALESIHGNRSSADKVTAAQSGKALEMMHQSLVWLADKLRTSYGDRGLLLLMRMIVDARKVMEIKVLGAPIPVFPDAIRLKMSWPAWFNHTERDKKETTDRVVQSYNNGLISEERAVAILSDANAVADVAVELKKIAVDQAAKDGRAIALAAQVKASETLPA